MNERIVLAGLLKLQLPGQQIRMVDSGVVYWEGQQYQCTNELLGVLDRFESLTEGVGDEAPAGALTFLPPPEDEVPASALNRPEWQGSRLQLWSAEIDADTGEIVGTPEQEADWIVDFPAMTLGLNKRELELAFVSGGDRFFQIDRGNLLSPSFHRSVHPGEAGLDNAVGVETAVPWGAPAPARGVTTAGGSLGGGYGGGYQGLVRSV